MTNSNAGKATNSRQKYAKSPGETTEKVENQPDQSLNADKVEEVSQLPAGSSGLLAVAGVRPIGASDLEVAEHLSIAGVRPVSTSSLEVVDTYNSMGIRPIGANTFEVVESINLSGIRPIGSSLLVIDESYSTFGNRPIASNEVDNSESLMGFLD
ncbi:MULTISPECIES: hypothetical protein [unclassified Nostoc]|uniref:hypothetical protein n=1 Tax=unclassified Nostoc TaxID=2593658 RepID=UPI0025E5D3BD|nr:hypothetical protein [Nostoc sp. JL33]MBN3869274.1 hypothetical protein [Nostoc sp. JL33]